MTAMANLDERVTELENQMAEVRYLAGKADKDVSDFRTVLIGHTGVINAIREDQVKQGERLARVEQKVNRVEQKVNRVETEMRSGFTKVDENFAKVEAKFVLLAQGQDKITQLLTRHIEECEQN